MLKHHLAADLSGRLSLTIEACSEQAAYAKAVELIEDAQIQAIAALGQVIDGIDGDIVLSAVDITGSDS